jgi:phenylacetic acid degradation operon negative regulatory protein
MMSGDLPRQALDALHAQTPLRVWSLIVTIFGDAVMREGAKIDTAPVATASLQALLALLRIDANAMRASLSRLTAAGTLQRTREGRNTFYALSTAAAREFSAAGRRIYGREPPPQADRIEIAAIHRIDDRSAAREAMIGDGWRFLGPATALRPAHSRSSPDQRLPDRAIAAVALDTPALADAVRELWDVASLNDGYARFAEMFGEAASAAKTPADAAALRILLVHQFRRLLLRDAFLPRALLPADWRGPAARRVFDAARAALRPASERWLAENGFGPHT